MKLPWFKFFPADWLDDPNLRQCEPETKGIWIDLICFMHKNKMSGQVSGTIEKMARICGASVEQFAKAMQDLKETGTADVHLCNNSVTVTNRRMEKEDKARQEAALRVKKHRENRVKQKSNGSVTVQKTEVRSQKSENTKYNPPKGGSKTVVLPLPINGHENGLKSQADDYVLVQKEMTANPGEASKILKAFFAKQKPEITAPYVDAWNLFAAKYQLPKVGKLTDGRKRKLLKRISEPEFEFFKILSAASQQKWLFGDNQRGWRMDFDYLIRNEEIYNSILEKRDQNAFQY